MTGRRPSPRLVTIVAAVVGAGLVLLAASRRWSTVVESMPAPLPARVSTHTGADLVPALPALALVALAGAGGLLAVGGRPRRVVAALLTLAGLGIVVLAATHLAASAGWATLSLVGGLLAAAAGIVALRRGRDWPVLGRRFDRRATRATAGGDAWGAFERGEDPTRLD